MVEDKGRGDAAVIARLDALVKAADGGDPVALRQVREVFDTVPELWDIYGNLAAIAEATLTQAVAGASAMTRVGLQRKLAAMRIDLAGHDPSSLERLAAERIVATWLLSYEADLAYARSLQVSSTRDSECYERRQDRAARQLLRALRSMALIRRLVIPHQVQINVGERQVNISGARQRPRAPAQAAATSQEVSAVMSKSGQSGPLPIEEDSRHA